MAKLIKVNVNEQSRCRTTTWGTIEGASGYILDIADTTTDETNEKSAWCVFVKDREYTFPVKLLKPGHQYEVTVKAYKKCKELGTSRFNIMARGQTSFRAGMLLENIYSVLFTSCVVHDINLFL